MAIIDENAQATKQDTPIYTSQGQEEQSKARMIKELFLRSKRATDKLRSQWPRNYRFVFSGQQWPIERPSWRFAEVVNTIWADMMTELGIQTDSRPKTDFLPPEPSDIEFVDILSKINDANWTKYNWMQMIMETVLDTKWVHVAHVLDEWNPLLNNGLGDIEKRVLDPYGCYWDPKAKDLDDSRWFIYIEIVPTERLKNMYPDHAQHFKEDVEKVGDGNTPWTRISPDSDRPMFGMGGVYGGRPKESDRYGGEKMTMLYRCWIKDESVEELAEDKMTDSGEIKKEYILKKKYPKGRYMEMASNIVLKDHENGVMINGKVHPYEHGRFPVVKFVNYSYAREYAGENEVTHKIGPQIISNYTWAYTIDTLKMQNNPKEIFSIANQEAAENSSNEPGQTMVLPDFNGYRREAGEGIPANIINLVDKAQSMADKVGGTMDVARGQVDPSVTSGKLFEGYVEAAQIRPRLKNRFLEGSLQRMGQLDASYYLQFYTADRVFRLTNKQGWPEYVKFGIEGEGEKKQARITRTVKEGPEDPYKTLQTYKVPLPKGMVDVEVSTGSSIPFQKALKFEKDLQLFNAGLLDQQAVLEDLEYPNWEKVLERMKAAQAAMPEGK